MAWANLDPLTPTNLSNKDNAGPVFNVKDPTYGAMGDNSTDDTAALQAAIDAAIGTAAGTTDSNGEVYIPAGIYLISSDLVIPEQVIVRGAGIRATELKWTGSGSHTTACVWSGSTLLTAAGFAEGITIRDLRINASSQSVGLALYGWNEACELINVEINSAASECLRIDATAQPATNRTQHAWFRNVKLVPNDSSVVSNAGMVCRDVQRCSFQNVTVDVASPTTGVANGIILRDNCNGNVFNTVHLENCHLPLDIGQDAACAGNVFNSLDVSFGELSAASIPRINVGSQDTSIAILVRTGTKHYTFLGVRDNDGYQNVFYDQEKERRVIGDGTGVGITQEAFIFGSDTTNSATTQIFLSSGEQALRQVTAGVGFGAGVATPTEELHLSGATLRVATNAGAIAGGDAGNAGDVMWGTASGASYVYICTSANSWMRATLNPF